ncbi:F-box/FBD/LRR-repeat protein At5g53840-like [Lycium ferocissimum]|uniref:F-box/FBD/LRR-repeat protein At5g53840-like n=1 Tax=Lycium ferocissimum TaxID=112874 RepID=UPI002815F56C|nr:F-box/FBD/LRR-repeat protein At5g53840-like [Lycium ferocissimum]
MAETKDGRLHKHPKHSFGETIDRISELPVHIIHHIFSKFNQKEAAKTCVLSKRWYYCWTSRPILVFCQLPYMPLEKFVKLVDQFLQPHLEENLHLEEFNLQYPPELASHHIDRWIDLAVKLNVKVLKIDTSDDSGSHNLPDVIYAAKKLTTLKLSRCKFEFDISTTSIIRFCCLKDLHLSYVHISERQLQRVFDRRPFIRNLSLSNCEGISKLHVRNLEEVEIQAPNLLEFNFGGDKMAFSSMDPSSLESVQLSFWLFETPIIIKFGNVDSSWCTNLQHFLQKFNYSKGLILVISCCRTQIILIYEDPREIIVPPCPNIEIFIAPMQRVESIIDRLMFRPPKIISVLPCTKSKVLQVLPEIKGCPKKRKSGKDCLSNIECFYCQRELKEVGNFMDTTDEEMASWYSWLKSTPLIDQVTTFTFNS